MQRRGLSLPFGPWRVRLRLPASRPPNEAGIGVCESAPRRLLFGLRQSGTWLFFSFFVAPRCANV